jgi:hypothetical protein
VVCCVVLCVLCRSEPPSDTTEQPGLTREQILSACDASLRRLQTDYIDLYQIHCEQQQQAEAAAAAVAAARSDSKACACMFGSRVLPRLTHTQKSGRRMALWQGQFTTVFSLLLLAAPAPPLSHAHRAVPLCAAVWHAPVQARDGATCYCL